MIITDSIVQDMLKGIGVLLAMLTIVLAWFGSRISRILNEIKQAQKDRDDG